MESAPILTIKIAYKTANMRKTKIGHSGILKVMISHKEKGKVKTMSVVNKIALTIAIIGALNWGSVGLFRFDLVSWIFGGQDSLWARIIYTVVALAGIWCITLLFRPRAEEVYHE